MNRGAAVVALCWLVLVAAGCPRAGQEPDAGYTELPGAGDATEARQPPEDNRTEGGAELRETELAPDPFAGALPLLPGPGQPGHDAELEKLARLYDRQFHLFNAVTTGLNQDATVLPSNTNERALIESFLRESEGWDLEQATGKKALELVSGWAKVAGLYGGVGIAADAYRYGVLRDQGYPESEVAVARDHLLAAIAGFHLAATIPGVPGVIARGFLRKGLPGDAEGVETVPLFDESGKPLPEIKNNGCWREDNSGLYPEHLWEDSCSRDMYIGWAAGAAAAWEVIRDDPAIADEVRQTLRNDARELGQALTVVRASGYDLELPDADGRTTLHGYLNEQCLDSNLYVPGLKNGFHAAMALGAVAAWVHVSGDPELESYLYDQLIGQRQLHLMPAVDIGPVNTGVGTNFSNFNMVFQGIWLALRYLDKSPEARAALRPALAGKLYDNGGERQPREMGQSLFDFIYAAGVAGSSVAEPLDPALLDLEAVARGRTTLSQFRVPPFWEEEVVNCDEGELAAGKCIALDGSELEVIGEAGWKGTLVCKQVLPMAIRPASNYYWRSNPYSPNGGGDGSRLLPGVDFRYAYWLGRWTR